MTSRRVATLTICGLLGTGLSIVSLSAASPGETSPSDRAVGLIAQERLDIATRGYQRAEASFRNGVADHKQLDEWVLRRASAARDLTNAAQRIAILSECLSQLKKDVSATEQLAKMGAASPDDAYLAQDRVLECELWLAKARPAH